MVEAEPEAKRAKFAPPTVAEVAALRERQDLYAGRLAQLKVDEIVAEITPEQTNVDALFATLKKDLLSATEKPALIDLERPPARVDATAVPLIVEPEKVKGQMRLVPPTQVVMTGAYAVGAAIVSGEALEVDVAVTLPESITQEKDHWDERYFRKRAIYLAYLAAELNKLKKYKLEFNIPRHRLKPTLKITKDNVSFVINISASPFCKLSKFAPGRSNIHFDWWNQSKSETLVPPPTPLYNALVLGDICREDEMASMSSLAEAVPKLGDGLRLFALYVRQGALEHIDAFDLGSALCRLLHQEKRLPRLASGFQIFRIMLDFLASGALSERVHALDESSGEGHSVPALVLESGRNVLAGYTRVVLEWITWTISRDVAALKSDQSRALVDILVGRRPFESNVSMVLCLPDDGALECVLKRNKQPEQVAGLSGDCSLVSLDYLCLILKTAMNDRLLALNPRVPSYPSWSITSKAPSSSAVSSPTIGLVLTDSAGRNESKVYRGPVADQPKAKQFRGIWGPKTEERRFQDGSICVAAHFDSSDPIGAAAKFLMTFHGQVTAVQVAGQVIPEEDSLGAEFAPLRESFSTLEQILRSPELSVPLKIQACWPVSASLRGTGLITTQVQATHQPPSSNQRQVDIPETRSKAPLFAANDILLQLEGSSQWPQNLEAILQLRKAYHIRLADLLTNKFKVKAAVAKNGEAVLCRHQGHLFRLVTVYHRVAELLKETTCPRTGMILSEDNAKSEEEELKTQIQPQLCLVLSKLNSIEQSICRLFRRWLSAHLLSAQIDPLLSDLLVYAALRIGEKEVGVGSALNGFYRVLRFVANHDFVEEPVFIVSAIIGDENGADISEGEQLELRDYFRENRLALFRQQGILVSSKVDKKKSLITRNGPNFAIVKKLQSLAMVTTKMLSTMITEGDLTNWKSLFVTSTKWLDAIITLRNQPPPREKVMKEKERNMSRIQVPDWDLGRLLVDRLERAYGHLAMFFRAEDNTKVVGVKFKKIKELKGLEGESNGGLAQSTEGLYINKAGLLNDFRILGNGIIDNISVQKE